MIVLSIHFSIIKFMIEVWKQYQSKDSSFKVYNEPITNFPTLTFCTGRYSNYIYQSNFTFYYADYHSQDYYKLDIGTNQINRRRDNSTIGVLYIEEVYTFVSGMCYKIYSRNFIIESGAGSSIYIEFNETIEYDDLLEVLEFYFTSEINSHGIVFNEWKDGQELDIKVYKVFNVIHSKKKSFRRKSTYYFFRING